MVGMSFRRDRREGSSAAEGGKGGAIVGGGEVRVDGKVGGRGVWEEVWCGPGVWTALLLACCEVAEEVEAGAWLVGAEFLPRLR